MAKLPVKWPARITTCGRASSGGVHLLDVSLESKCPNEFKARTTHHGLHLWSSAGGCNGCLLSLRGRSVVLLTSQYARRLGRGLGLGYRSPTARGT